MLRSHAGVLTRLLHVDGRPVVVHAWQRRGGEVALRAVSQGPAAERERALERLRFALAVDDDLSRFYAAFKRDPLLGPAIRRRPWLRAPRRPFAWEALAWAITEQLIESSRATQIQRRIVRRWGAALEPPGATREPPGATRAGAGYRGAARGVPRRASARASRARSGAAGPALRDVPDPATIAALAPWELVACELAPRRALALIRCADEIASGRADPADPGDDRRFAAISEIGPWTLACLALHGRGEADALPAGDLAYLKLVGVLARLGRRATIAEVEEFFAPYAPFRALAGAFALAHYGPAAASAARALPLAPDHYADAA